jgi:hypothetical protein
MVSTLRNTLRYMFVYLLLIASIVLGIGYVFVSFFEFVLNKGR